MANLLHGTYSQEEMCSLLGSINDDLFEMHQLIDLLHSALHDKNAGASEFLANQILDIRSRLEKKWGIPIVLPDGEFITVGVSPSYSMN